MMSRKSIVRNPLPQQKVNDEIDRLRQALQMPPLVIAVSVHRETGQMSISQPALMPERQDRDLELLVSAAAELHRLLTNERVRLAAEHAHADGRGTAEQRLG